MAQSDSSEEFDPAVLEQTKKINRLATLGTSAEQYQRLHPSSTTTEILQYETLNSVNKKRFTNFDILRNETQNNQRGSSSFRVDDYLCGNSRVERGTNHFYGRTMSEELFLEKGLKKKNLPKTPTADKLLKKLQAVTNADGKEVERPSAVQTVGLHHGLAHFVALMPHVTNIASCCKELSEELVPVIRRQLINEFGQEYPPIRTFDFQEISAKLLALEMYVGNVAYATREAEKLLSEIVRDKKSDVQILREAKALEIKFPRDKKERSWKQPAGEDSNTRTVIVREGVTVKDFAFAKKKSDKYKKEYKTEDTEKYWEGEQKKKTRYRSKSRKSRDRRRWASRTPSLPRGRRRYRSPSMRSESRHSRSRSYHRKKREKHSRSRSRKKEAKKQKRSEQNEEQDEDGN